jgi:hypothetical protein
MIDKCFDVVSWFDIGMCIGLYFTCACRLLDSFYTFQKRFVAACPALIYYLTGSHVLEYWQADVKRRGYKQESML